ncbi:MAG: hypothetical protein ACRESI_00415, partial [Gammaproteobacteria bacterium]
PSLPHAVDASALAGRHRLPSLTSLDLNTENTIFGFLHFSIIFRSVSSQPHWLKMLINSSIRLVGCFSTSWQCGMLILCKTFQSAVIPAASLSFTDQEAEK